MTSVSIVVPSLLLEVFDLARAKSGSLVYKMPVLQGCLRKIVCLTTVIESKQFFSAVRKELWLCRLDLRDRHVICRNRKYRFYRPLAVESRTRTLLWLLSVR